MQNVKGHFDRQTQAHTDTHNRPTLKLHYLITTAVPGCNNCQARRQEMKWGGVCKKWTFSQRTVHYVYIQYQYFLFYILLIWGVRKCNNIPALGLLCVYAPNAPPPAYGPEIHVCIGCQEGGY